MSEAIALIDANNFYASCEQAFDPSLINKPVIVLSNNDGCIVARSSQARELGIRMGQPYFQVKDDLKSLGVVIRSCNYALYGDMSQRLMKLLRNHCDELEIYSIDEAFVQLKRPTDQDLSRWARQLRALINKSLGIPISIGIGSSKGQSKLANYLAKIVNHSAGIFDLTTIENIDDWIGMVPINKVWGIGPKMANWCRMQGVTNALQLRDMPERQLKLKAGIKGVRLQYELRGQNFIPIKKGVISKKETCVSRSFKQPLNDLQSITEAIATHTIRVSEKLRRQKQLTNSITVFIRTSHFSSRFYSNSATMHLDIPTNDTSILIKAATSLTKKIFKQSYPPTKVGVIVRELQDTYYLQKYLFTQINDKEQQKRDRLLSTIDKLNNRYGRNTIGWAVSGLNHALNMPQEYLSNAATTRIMEIPTVRA